VILELLARILRPKSHCAGCGRPWFSDKRQPCNRCGSSARRFVRTAHDGMTTHDKAS
jgi:rRNA maturation endonuclease Nob1